MSATVSIKLFIPTAAVISAAVIVGDGVKFTPRRSGDNSFDIDFTAPRALRTLPAAVRVGAFPEHIVEFSYADKLGIPLRSHDLTDIDIEALDGVLRFTIPDAIIQLRTAHARPFDSLGRRKAAANESAISILDLQQRNPSKSVEYAAAVDANRIARDSLRCRSGSLWPR